MAEERAVRRLAAILAADVVGYSRMMGADEPGTLARLKAFRNELFDPETVRHAGRIFKTTGDGALVEFPSAVDAVQAAIAIQDGLAKRNAGLADDQRIDLRIGIGLADVIVEGDDLFGNGVNIAARLEGLAEPGGICISGSVHEHVRAIADIGFADLGEQSVKNIAEPVRAYRVLPDGPGAVATGAIGPSRWSGRRAVAALAAVVIVSIAGGLAWWQPWAPDFERASVERMALPLPNKPSIAVLPFDNLSGDRDQDYFADGLTEEIITNLAGYPSLFVIARNSTNKFKGQPVDVRAVAEDLGVRYVLEGSVRRGGDTLRITAQLIDALSGRHIWANKYDRELKDIFALQDELTAEIGSRLVSKIAVAEAQRRARRGTKSVAAYDLYLQAQAVWPEFNPRANARAIELLDQAIALDPEYARAISQLSLLRRFNYLFRWAHGPKDNLKYALELATKAVQLDPDDSKPHEHLQYVYHTLGDYDRAVEEGLKAISLSPNDADAHMSLAFSLTWAGRAEEAVRHAETAMRLNPRARSTYLQRAGYAYYMARRFDKAAASFDRAIALNPRNRSGIRAWRAAAYAQLGRTKDAARAAREVLAERPDFTIRGFFERSHARAEFKSLLADGFRKAGLPEGGPPKSDAPPLSIVVLPFDNLSGDPKQDYLADGITEDLIADLSRIRGAFVIARSTSFTYRGMAVDAKEVASELNVRYVLEGSVRRSGDSVRTNAQLIDGVTGGHIWSDRFDRRFAEMFSLQNEITGRIATTLRLELLRAESDRLAKGPPENLDAWDHALRGWTALWAKPVSGETLVAAEPELRKALELDPKQALAWTGMARFYQMQFIYGQWRTMDQDEALAKQLESARFAVKYDPRSAAAHVALSYGLRLHGQDQAAESALKTALDLNPNYEEAYTALANLRLRRGRPEEALQNFDVSLRLAPRIPNAARRYFFMGQALLMAKRYDQAVATIQKGIAADAGFPSQYHVLASALAWLGRIDEAKEALAKWVELNPRGNSIAYFRKVHRQSSQHFENAYEGLRRAGMPEK